VDSRTVASHDNIGALGPEQTRSLRRECARAFMIILFLLLAMAAIAVVGIRAVVGEIEGTVLQLHGQSATLAAEAGLAHSQDLERILVGALGVLFVVGLAAGGYVCWRVARDVLEPVAAMSRYVSKLQDGDYSSRIEFVRRDELGELAEGLNGMAEALQNSQRALAIRATHDSLTGLANRATLTERLTASFRSGSERRARQESLLFVDIDDFKHVNDDLGHESGDALLLQLATRLNGCVRAHDLVARLGGDGFAIMVMEEDESGSTATEVAMRVLDALRAPFLIGGEFLTVTVSIGVAQRRPQTLDAAELLQQADFAMHMAKDAGRGQYQLFDADLHDSMVDRSSLKAHLAVAVTSGQLRLEYQPIANLHTGEILGVEALVRWQHPTLGLLRPETFIPLAEQTGDIDAIGCWVLDTATRQVSAWRLSMDHCHSMWVSVNLSALQLVNPRSLTAIQSILADPLVQADKVVLEVTESVFEGEALDGVTSLRELKGLGVRIAIDNFGTGSSALGTLADLPVDILKIDGTSVFGQSFPTSPESATPAAPALPPAHKLQSILGMAGKLSLAVIAEGIEEPDQLDLLRWLGCTMGQGYLLAWPAGTHVLESMLASGGLLQLGPSAEVGG
jgi:diguanylate cyclase (GGDEF)-like protein